MSSTEHISGPAIKGYRTRTLAAGDLLAVAEHLASCEPCRRKVAPDGVQGKLAEALRGEHLQYEALEGLVNGGREGLEHVAVCSMCASELDDLRIFRAGLAKPTADWRGWRIWVPAGVLALTAVALMGVFLRTGPVSTPSRPAPAVIASPAVVASLGVVASPPVTSLAVTSLAVTSLAVTSLNDAGGVVSLDQAGTLTGLAGLSADESRQMAEVLRTGSLPVAATGQDLLRSRETLLGGPSAAVALTPVGPVGTVVPAERPAFLWQAPGNASGFQVRIYDANFDLVAQSPVLTGHEWVSVKALPRGRTFSWTVSARVGGARVTAPHAPEPEARFRVASAAVAGEWEAVRQATPASDLRLAVTAARLGLRAEAGEALERLAAQNPGSALAAQLRAGVLPAK